MIALLISATVGTLVSFLITRWLISFLRVRGVGQHIRDEGPEAHRTKAGTPTMGGVGIVAGGIVGYLAAHIRPGAIFTEGGLAVMVLIAGSGLVGLIDDLIKVVRERNLGLNKRAKIIGLLATAAIFAMLAINRAGVSEQISFTRAGQLDLELGELGWAVWAIVFVLGFSNAVNLTDGLDGLAGGASAIAYLAYVVVAFWAFRHPDVYAVPQALDLAIIAAAVAGGCIGFLWWNAPPAQIFMGDAGSLALGAGLAGLALLTNTDLLLLVVGGLFVIETASVIVQVGSFRLFNHRRVFRMAPIHHHFELAGWPETTVLIRLWIFNGACVALGLGIYYADFLSTGAID